MEGRYRIAKAYLLWGDMCNVPVGLLAIIFAFIKDGTGYPSLWAGITSAVIVTGQQLLWVRQRANYGLGEELRRRLHLADGLGLSLTHAELSKEKVNLPERPTISVPPYYRSTCPPGYRRLTEAVLESAFWSEHLHKVQADLYLAAAAVSTTLFLMVVLVVGVFGYAKGCPSVGRAVLAALMLLTEFSLWERCWSHYQSHLQLERIYHAAFPLLTGIKAVQQDDAIRLYANYSAVALSSYPIPDAVYKRRHDVLEREWQSVDADLSAHRGESPGPLS
jgi:hypothetical protein